MKNFLKVAAAAALGLALSGTAQAQSALNEILDDGVLKVGTTGDWNPMSVRDPATNSYKGFDIDVMTELAKDLGVEVEFVPTDWKTLVNGVVAGKYHITGSASISPPRMKVAGFSESYISVEIFPFTTEDKAGNFDGFQEVLSGRADVFITSNIEGSTLEAKFPIVRVANTEPRSPTPIAMLLPQADQVWINYVNNWVKVKQAKGFFDATKTKWGL